MGGGCKMFGFWKIIENIERYVKGMTLVFICLDFSLFRFNYGYILWFRSFW